MKKFYILATILIALAIFSYLYIFREPPRIDVFPIEDRPINDGGEFDIYDTNISFSYPSDMEVVDDTTICSIEDGCGGLRISVGEVEVDKYFGESVTPEDAKNWYLKAASCAAGYCLYSSWVEAVSDNPGLRTLAVFTAKKNSILAVTGEDTMSANGVFSRVTYIPFFMDDGIAKTIEVSIDTTIFPDEIESDLYDKVYELSDSIVDSFIVGLMD